MHKIDRTKRYYRGFVIEEYQGDKTMIHFRHENDLARDWQHIRQTDVNEVSNIIDYILLYGG